MKWNKRLKIFRISKVVIPIALAVSLIFAGFSVFAKEAENFVVRTNGDSDVKLSLSFNRDLSEQTSMLYAPVVGEYTNVGFVPSTMPKYEPKKSYHTNIPYDIATYDGLHSGYNYMEQVTFFSFSFYLINNSKRAVDVDYIMNIDGVITSNENDTNYHVDDAIKVMLIQGEELLTDESKYVVYSKQEATDENREELYGRIEYEDRIVNFVDNSSVFKRTGENGIKSLAAGKAIKFTLVIWLEGEDPNCKDPILGEKMKMSMDFMGY